MSDESFKALTTYSDVCRFIADKMGLGDWDGDSEYYPFSQGDVRKGFLELIFPVADSSGGLLRGASGNGPIFIFLYCRGTWTYLGEMHGAQVTADIASGTTEFRVYSHTSAVAGFERRYQLRGAEYVCISEREVIAE